MAYHFNSHIHVKLKCQFHEKYTLLSTVFHQISVECYIIALVSWGIFLNFNDEIFKMPPDTFTRHFHIISPNNKPS